jgi:hypothetical protein
MTPRDKLFWCLITNCFILVVVMTLVIGLAEPSSYWRFGWSDELIVISVRIDSMMKYTVLLVLIVIINVTRVIVEELGMPVLGFSIYNPDKKVIKDFSKNELQFFANSMFIVSGMRGLFMTIISITQFDLALWSLLASEFASFYTIRVLLNEKKFLNDDEYDQVDVCDQDDEV